MNRPSALSNLKILEYGDMVPGAYCARLLADAGADVVKVEPPGGDSARRNGPFPGDAKDPNWSGLYLYLNANKRGITLDLATQKDMTVFKQLAAKADVLVLDNTAAEIDNLGLRRHDLQALNPGLIVTAITPFGLTGPKRDHTGDDLIAVSAGGMAYATPGMPDMIRDPEKEPPLRANTYVGDILAGVQGAVATMVAVLSRSLNGQGSEVDVSRQEAVSMVLPFELAHASHHEAKRREPTISGAMPNAYLPCKDGYVVIMAVMDAHWRALMDLTGNPDWGEIEIFANAQERARNWDALEPLLMEWTMNLSGAEITRLAQAQGIPCFPAYSVGDMVDSEHVKAREFMWQMEGPQGQKFQLPGYPVRMAATPWQLRRPAPKLGEHNDEVIDGWLK
ncbi:MAG TPA: CoA transferase [Dehalococcoidia bacterium]|nr:CoA transferase [Dehalococcoidia bacterium]